MAGLTRRSCGHKHKQIKKANLKTKRYRRDVDQVVLEDMIEENAQKLLNQDMDEYKPGLGQHYCLPCARYFVSDQQKTVHLKTKSHKKRVKTTKNIPYSHEEAERAGGLQPEKVRFTDAIYSGKTKMQDLTEFSKKEEVSKKIDENMK